MWDLRLLNLLYNAKNGRYQTNKNYWLGKQEIRHCSSIHKLTSCHLGELNQLLIIVSKLP
jgi:hypothetical protein